MRNLLTWFHKRNKVDTQALIADLLYRLDNQDRQMCRMERVLEDQDKHLEKLIKRIDQATGRGAA